MSNSPLLFNPSRATIEELEATFVGRRDLLEKLEGDLLRDAKKKTKRHWQLIGPRGSGKSHFTELIARRLTREHAWAVARLPEEHYQVTSVGTLLEQISMRLEGLDRSPFKDVDSNDLEDRALDRIRTFARESKRSLLVVLENLGILFERKLRDRRSQSRLREILTRDSPFILLATATSYVDATVTHDAPFYDFFQVLVLEDLKSDDVADLVEARARWDMDEFLLTRLDTVRARIHAVFHFSGGNPRLVLALYSILRTGFTDELHTQILKLLDEVTPYYQHRLHDISPQMERILAEMALSGAPLTPSEIGRRCRMPVNHVTANITKLVHERFARPVGRPDKRRRYYDLNDRLFRLWMQMREDQNAGQRLRFLSEFFQRWYEGHPEEVRHAASRVATAFWSDIVGDRAAQRCREHLATLEYLQDALPSHSEFLLTRSLRAQRPPPSKVDEEIRQLRTLHVGRDSKVRAVAANFLASALAKVGQLTEAIKVLQESDTDTAPHKLRYSNFSMMLLMIADVSGFEEAKNQYESIVRSDDVFVSLNAVMCEIAVSLGLREETRKYLNEFVVSFTCEDCIASQIQAMVMKLVDREKFELLDLFFDQFTRWCSPSAIELEALHVLAASDASKTADRFLEATAVWSKLSDVPSWLLWPASCAISHTPERATFAFDMIVALVERGCEFDDHTAYHVLLVLVEMLRAGDIRFNKSCDWFTEVCPTDLLKEVFVEWMPECAKTSREYGVIVLRLFSELVERGALPKTLEPYAPAVEVAGGRIEPAALAPEIQEAVKLLLEGASALPKESS